MRLGYSRYFYSLSSKALRVKHHHDQSRHSKKAQALLICRVRLPETEAICVAKEVRSHKQTRDKEGSIFRYRYSVGDLGSGAWTVKDVLCLSLNNVSSALIELRDQSDVLE